MIEKVSRHISTALSDEHSSVPYAVCSMHVVRSPRWCHFFYKWHQDAQNGRRLQPSAASIEDDLAVSPRSPPRGAWRRLLCILPSPPPLCIRRSLRARLAWTGWRADGWRGCAQRIDSRRRQSRAIVALREEEEGEGEVNYCAARNAHVQ